MLTRWTLCLMMITGLICLAGIMFSGLAGRVLAGDIVTYLALVNPARGDYDILVLDMRTQIVHNLTRDPASDFNFSWSPDGTHLAFLSNRGDESDIYLMQSSGRGITRLKTGLNPQELAWSPDGSRIGFLAARESGLYDVYTIQVDSGEIHDLTDTMVVPETAFVWSPDGSQIVYIEAAHRLMVVNRDGGVRHYLTETHPRGIPAWSPDGAQVAHVLDGRVHITPLAGETTDALDNTPLFSSLAAWSRDGTRLAYLQDARDSVIRVLTLADGATQDFPVEPEVIRELAWSPDGTMLLLGALPTEGGIQQIYRLTLADGVLTRLTNSLTFYRGAVWK